MKRKTLSWIITLLVLAGLIAFGMRPKPVEVDLGAVTRGPMTVTVNEDGETRIREPYLISAPLSGRLLRVELEPGDAISKGQFLSAIDPGEPGLIDARTEAQSQARVNAAQAAHQRAESQVEIAEADVEQAQRYIDRDLGRLERGNISDAEFADSEHALRVAQGNLAAAKSSRDIAVFDLEQAKAALLYSKSLSGDGEPTGRHFEITSPIDGVVLRKFQESSTVIPAGERILEIGDPHDLEVRIDVLSQDAVRIQPGQRIIIQHWGGTEDLNAWVRRVEPSAFTKVSALGVDEQRVWVYGDFSTDSETGKAASNQAADSAEPGDSHSTELGDAYRIEARVVVWEKESVLRVPAGALFRNETPTETGETESEQEWAVYRLGSEGKAEKVIISIGERNDREAEVLNGLDDGDRVVMHPSDKIAPGVFLAERKM